MAEPWPSVQLNEILEELDERCGNRDLPVLSVTKDRGIMLASERFDRALHGRNLPQYRVAPRGSITLDPMLLWSGTIGRQKVVEVGIVSPDYRVYETRQGALSEFLEYAFKGRRMAAQFKASARGTNVRRNRISRSDFAALKLELPPLREQRKIAAILSSVDEAIEKTQSVIDQVQVVKKGLMQELLTKGLPGRHRAFMQTAIGEVPSNWKVARIADVASVRSGSTPSRSRKDFFPASGGHPWVKTMDLTDGDIHTTSETISDAALAESSCVLHRPGTVLIAMYGGFNQIGRTGILRLAAATNQAISCISTPTDILAPEFLNYWLIANRWRWQRIAASSRKDPNITRDDVLRFELPLMSIEEQNAIIAVLNAVVDRETAEKRQFLGLLDTKSALSTLLLTGELRVRPDPEPTP